MEIYNKNLELLKEKQKDIYQKLFAENTQIDKDIIEAVYSFETKDNHSGIIIKREGKEYRLNSMYRPINEAEKWAEQFKNKYRNIKAVACMFGLGNGMFAEQMLKRLQQDAFLCIYEPSAEIFQYSIEHFDLSALLLDKRVQFFVKGINDDRLDMFLWNHLHWSNIKSQIVCHHPQYDKAFIKECVDFLLIAQNSNEKIMINKNTESFFGRGIAFNTIKNIKYITNANTTLEYYHDFPKDIPAIVVSAGPSLNKNIEELKRAKGKSVIFATDTAMKYLLEHQILPDFIVTLDPKKPPKYLSDPICKDIPLFCKIEANSEILKNHDARKIWFNCGPYLVKLYERYGKEVSNIEAGGSVATGAFGVCVELGFEHIVLIGQDLAYGENGVSHANGEIHKVRAEKSGIREIEDIHGNLVKTRHDWYIYLQWFENSIRDLPNIDVIDATEGGAKIHGTRLLTLKEVIDQYCTKEIDCSKIVENKPNGLTLEELKDSSLYFQHSLEELKEMKEKAEEGITICDRVLRLIEKNPYANLDNFSKKLVKANQFIEKKDIYDIIDLYIAHVASQKLADVYVYSEDKKQDLFNTYQNTKEVYQAVIQAVEEITPIFKEELKDFLGGNVC